MAVTPDWLRPRFNTHTRVDTVRRTLHPQSDASPAFAASCRVGRGLRRFSTRRDRHRETRGGRGTPRETVFLQYPARQLESACAPRAALPASAVNAVVRAR